MAPFGTLYTTVNFLHARVTKILAAANLNNLDIQIAPDLQYGITNHTAAYRAKFPHGKIPAFETPSGFHLAEGSAIAYYVAECGPRREQLLGRTPEDRALVQMYSKEDVEVHETQFVRCLRRLEEQLAGEGKVWLVRDDELSLADLSVASGLLWPLKMFMDAEFRAGFPRVMEWWGRLMAVEGVGKAFGAPVKLAGRRPAADGSEAEARRGSG
ncbi:glutathione S-transferase [Karstenula rhodostoma CBS 690.94]|uniref:Glutathione S-transferase n=1 Tax=Karstenula rhodostoma CBS 690.94 TaxID=1392251 RepID=A0A9P4U9U1_9PLEO|nr:glutathione S-transferase [Karstenula rhodostoma CBS 690.94]